MGDFWGNLKNGVAVGAVRELLLLIRFWAENGGKNEQKLIRN